jgi:coenzyme F420-dependent glucose-6-phosphate dehydrogenase
MVQLGYAMSCEEHPPNDLVRHAKRAEEAGFTFALISDHFHPWISKQGHSPLVWSVLGGIAAVTEKLRVGTGVTCPTIRIHPAIIAQAAATVASMMPGRFFLGVGTGENLNEHITGQRWPEYEIRAEMLEEAIEVIRLLWEGGVKSYHGKYYTVENAQLYTLPDALPEIMVAAGGSRAAELAGRIGDGLISTSAEKEIVDIFEQDDQSNRPKIGQFAVCCAESETESRRVAYEYWPNAGLKGELSQELPMPKHFEQAVQIVTEEQVAQSVICSNKPQEHLDKIQEYIDAGFDHIYVHQIGPDQNTFFDFYRQHILPAFA